MRVLIDSHLDTVHHIDAPWQIHGARFACPEESRVDSLSAKVANVHSHVLVSLDLQPSRLCGELEVAAWRVACHLVDACRVIVGLSGNIYETHAVIQSVARIVGTEGQHLDSLVIIDHIERRDKLVIVEIEDAVRDGYIGPRISGLVDKRHLLAVDRARRRLPFDERLVDRDGGLDDGGTFLANHKHESRRAPRKPHWAA